MVELIFLIVLISSLIGALSLVYQKMPLLLESPEVLKPEIKYKDYLNRIKKSLVFKNFSFEIFLQKILSKIRVLTLKTDNKTSAWLKELREKAKNKNCKELGGDNYWKEIKKFKKKN